jgi:hypothetical protein
MTLIINESIVQIIGSLPHETVVNNLRINLHLMNELPNFNKCDKTFDFFFQLFNSKLFVFQLFKRFSTTCDIRIEGLVAVNSSLLFIIISSKT